MSYLSTDERTDVLLELIEDAEQQLNNGDDSVALLRTVIATAKRHTDWPENKRKRDEEYRLQKVQESRGTGGDAAFNAAMDTAGLNSSNVSTAINAPDPTPELTPI